MGNFFAELRRRHMYRVGAAYAVVAWLLLQLFNNLAPIYELPPWIGRALVFLLVLGFPVALLICWVQQLRQEGGAPKSKLSRLDGVLVVAVVLVVGVFAFQQFATTPDTKTGVDGARRAATSPATAIAIVVLPFVNLSSDKEQEFFSDGMTEEITTTLAKVPDLRVVGRTSAFQFKGQNQDLRDIGQKLSATHLIEGSVRKVGDRVRITAQLIKADDGTHVWAEDYDRQLTDIFQIQEDIARAITTSLRMPLGLKPGENLVANRKIDAESYQQYLRAKALTQGGGRQAFRDATALLEQIVTRNPDYAPAWALLGFYHSTTAFLAQFGPLEESRRIVDEFVPKAEAALRHAIQLDPNLADGYARLGNTEAAHGNVVAAEDAMLKALELDPNNPDVLNFYSSLLAKVGRLKDALPIRLKLRSVEPFVPTYNLRTATLLWLNGENDAALAMVKAVPILATSRARSTAMIYAAAGRYREAADALQDLSAGGVFASAASVQEAIRLLRSAPTSVSSTDNLPSLQRLSWVYLYVGAPEQSLQAQERMIDLGLLADVDAMEFWHADYAPVRKSERFKAFARKAGLVEYWRERGWPEFCHPTTSDDFACS